MSLPSKIRGCVKQISFLEKSQTDEERDPPWSLHLYHVTSSGHTKGGFSPLEEDTGMGENVPKSRGLGTGGQEDATKRLAFVGRVFQDM